MDCDCDLAGLHFEAEVSVTYVEIFGDDILDLLDDKKSAAHDHTRAVVSLQPRATCGDPTFMKRANKYYWCSLFCVVRLQNLSCLVLIVSV